MTLPAIHSPALTELDRNAIPYRLFIHTHQITSLEQAAEDRGQSPNQVVRSILFRLSREEFFLALVAGPQQIDWRGLRQYFNQSRLTMATPDEVLRITGYPPGAVSPFGLTSPVPVIVDPNVFAVEEISLGSGVRGAAIIMKSADLKTALGTFDLYKLITAE